jgi:hypothetical protein
LPVYNLTSVGHTEQNSVYFHVHRRSFVYCFVPTVSVTINCYNTSILCVCAGVILSFISANIGYICFLCIGLHMYLRWFVFCCIATNVCLSVQAVNLVFLLVLLQIYLALFFSLCVFIFLLLCLFCNHHLSCCAKIM